MIQFDGFIAKILSWVILGMSYGVLLSGALWLLVGVFALIEAAIVAMIVRLKAYPLFVDFIFHRKRYKKWAKTNAKEGEQS